MKRAAANGRNSLTDRERMKLNTLDSALRMPLTPRFIARYGLLIDAKVMFTPMGTKVIEA